MIRKLFGIVLLLLIAGAETQAAEMGFYGYVQNYSVFRSRSPGDILMLRNRLRLNTEIKGETARAWASLDVNSESQNGGTRETSLREAYLDLYFPHFDLRIGKQQVVWGKADGLFINDLVNPMDLRMFILQDFEDIRMGIDMLKTDVLIGNYSLEFVAIPKFVPTKLAPPGSPWAFPRPQRLKLGIPTKFVVAGTTETTVDLGAMGYSGSLPVVYTAEGYPENLCNAEFGWKLSGFNMGFDWSLILLKAREDQPVFFKSVGDTLVLPIPDAEIKIPTSLIFQEQHPWLRIYGANFSTSVGGFVLRGEGGFFKGKWFDYSPEIDLNDTITAEEIAKLEAMFREMQKDGLLKRKDYLQYMLGFDYSLTSSIDLNTQFVHQHIFDYESSILADENVYISTALLRSRYMNDTLSPTLLLIHNFTDDSSLIRFWLDWNAADAFTATVGIDVIDGEKDDFFGAFRDNDNFYLKLKYSF